jgi:hypothetical protein
MNQALVRFYDISGCYLDDERVAAWAVVTFKSVDVTAETVYRDLLACRFERWIDYLENIAENTKWDVLQEWCKQKEFELDMMNNSLWSPGDALAIENHRYKSIRRNEDE